MLYVCERVCVCVFVCASVLWVGWEEVRVCLVCVRGCECVCGGESIDEWGFKGKLSIGWGASPFPGVPGTKKPDFSLSVPYSSHHTSFTDDREQTILVCGFIFFPYSILSDSSTSLKSHRLPCLCPVHPLPSTEWTKGVTHGTKDKWPRNDRVHP